MIIINLYSNNNKVCKIWKEYLKELMGDDSERDESIGTVVTGVRREYAML